MSQSAFEITVGCWVKFIWFSVTGTVSRRFGHQARTVPSLKEHLSKMYQGVVIFTIEMIVGFNNSACV